MLDKVRMSACSPAPPLGSVAAKAQNDWADDRGMRTRGVSAGNGISIRMRILLQRSIRSHSCHERNARPYKTYMCLICGFIYDEAAGLPEEGIPAGTRWEDVPVNWVCPECGARKEDFELVEV